MNGEAVTEIAKLAQMSAEDSTVEVDEQVFTTRPLTRVSFEPVVEDGLLVHTLAAFVEILNTDFDKAYEEKELVALVESEAAVQLATRPVTEDMRRARPLRCEMLPFQGFPFGKWIPLEQFVIDMTSLFEDTSDRASIVSFVQKVDVSESIRYADNGITQVAEVKKGVSGAVTETQEAKAIARLKPYRTFREIEQPESEFLFRMRQNEGMVSCALFEADGGAWRLNAVAGIADFLRRTLSVSVLVVS